MKHFGLIFFVVIFIPIKMFAPIATSSAFATDVATSAFIYPNKLYLGAKAANADSSIAVLDLSRSNGAWIAEFIGKAYARGVTVNGVTKQQSCMYNQIIDKLAVQTVTDSKTSTKTKYLIAAANIPDGATTTLKSIAKLDLTKKVELTNANEVYDAAGTMLAKNDYAALAASSDNIFVAVPPSGGTFGAAGSGIVRLKEDKSNKSRSGGSSNVIDELMVQKLDGTGSADSSEKAYEIKLDAYPLDSGSYTPNNTGVNFAVQSGSSSSVTYSIDSAVDMWWDETLKCLYIGFVNSTTTATTPQAGVCTMLVGYISTNQSSENQLFIKTAIPLSVVINADAANSMIAYTSSNPSQKTGSTFKVRTMHTSTGRDYAIIVGDVADTEKSANTQVNVYALPLVSSSDQSVNGMIASSNDGIIDFSSPVSQAPQLYNKTSAIDKSRVTVGSSFQYLVHGSTDTDLQDAKINDIHVLGDTVFVSLSGSRGASGGGTSGESGIFTSTAIFDSNRSIRAWTPWERCLGSTDPTFFFGFDKSSSNIWYVNALTSGYGKATFWSQGDSTLHTTTLYSVLSSIFTDTYGIIRLINFDDETPGFLSWDPSDSYPNFSMLVATGLNKVALVQMGAQASSIFNPTAVFTLNTNVFSFDVAAGFITGAEVSRSTDEDCGWLFVSGTEGLAVLRSDEDGGGWTDLDALSGSDFPGAGYSFKILTDSSGNKFVNIVKLISDGTYLYAFTQNMLYVIKMNAANFYSGKISSSNLRSLPINQDKIGTVFDAILIDSAMSSQPQFALATSKGLITVTLNLNSGAFLTSTTILSGLAIKLNFVSALRGGKLASGKANGNLCVMMFDASITNLYVYRFNVKAASASSAVSISIFDEPYNESAAVSKYFYQITNIQNLEKGFYINQIFDYNLQLHQFANSLAVTPDPDKFLPDSAGVYQPINLGINTNKIPMFGTVTRDTASGALYVPGTFGLVVNE